MLDSNLINGCCNTVAVGAKCGEQVILMKLDDIVIFNCDPADVVKLNNVMQSSIQASCTSIAYSMALLGQAK